MRRGKKATLQGRRESRARTVYDVVFVGGVGFVNRPEKKTREGGGGMEKAGSTEGNLKKTRTCTFDDMIVRKKTGGDYHIPFYQRRKKIQGRTTTGDE